MRREEAEQEAAWRNSSDERRARLEFYAFDASAGLVDDAWEVTMRLRREPEPEPEPLAPTSAAARATGSQAPPAPDLEDLEARAARTRERSAAARRRSQPRLRRVAQPRVREPRPERRRTRRREREDEERIQALAPPTGWLTRIARIVGSTVILVAVLWVGLVTALAVLVRANSPTGLALYAAAVVVGLVAIAFGFAVRRS